MRVLAGAAAFALVVTLIADLDASAQAPQQPTLIAVAVDRAPVLVAPVFDAPVAAEPGIGETFESEAEVNGEEVGGNPRWHLITTAREPDLVRGFIHASLVASTP